MAGEGFVAGAFRHRTSRAGDPQLHTHVVVCNMTRGPDGRHSALDGRELYRQAKTAGFLYQAELRARLSDALGVEWGVVEQGVAEIEGIPRGLRERFSVRREQWLEDNGAALAELCGSEHELTRRRAQAHERALQAARIEPSKQLRTHLGERPESLACREQWDHAAAALLQYEQRFGELPGLVEPSDVGRRQAWRSLQRALAPLDRDMSPTGALDPADSLDAGHDFDFDP